MAAAIADFNKNLAAGAKGKKGKGGDAPKAMAEVSARVRAYADIRERESRPPPYEKLRARIITAGAADHGRIVFYFAQHAH